MKSKLKTAFLGFLASIPFFHFSGVKSRVYRAFGAEIGEHVDFAPGALVAVSDFKKLTIGTGVAFGPNVKINCDELEVGEDTRFAWGVTAAGPSILKVGKGCYFFPRVYIDLNEPVIIEDDVGIGADYIFTHSVWHPVTEGGPRKFASVHIKRGAWIPAGVFIMPGITIGEKATIGARSLILNDVPDGCLVAGVPAKIIRTAEENMKKLSLEEKDKIVKDIIEEYLGQIKRSNTIFNEKRYSDASFQVIEFESKETNSFLAWKKHWALIYKNDAINESHTIFLESLCKRFDSVLFVSLRSIPTEVTERLNKKVFSNMVWFSIEDRMKKKSWDKTAMSLHDFFRSRYGIRFRVHQTLNA